MLAIKYDGLLAIDRNVSSTEGGIESILFFISDKSRCSSNLEGGIP
jgi:hypothetical protein